MSTAEYDEQQKQKAADLAACIARVFLGDADGLRALQYLRSRFGIERLVFTRENGRVDAVAAALREGERHVMAEIEAALKTANPQAWAESLIQ